MITAALGLLLAAGPLDVPPIRVIEGVRIDSLKLAVQRKTKNTPPKKPGLPSFSEDQFSVATDYGPFKLKYTRFLNRSADLNRHPACITSDYGLGISGFGSNWYRSNTIRVLLDDEDIVARYAADSIDVNEGHDVTRIRFLWKLPKAELAIHVAVVNRRSEGFVQILVRPKTDLKSVGINLMCYPGGYGPAYGHLSRRVVRVGKESVSVATGQANRKLSLKPSLEWLWYADQERADRGHYSTGSVALVILPEDRAEGKVSVSSYDVTTALRYPGTQSRIRLALAAHLGPNQRARREFERSRQTATRILKTLTFWPE